MQNPRDLGGMASLSFPKRIFFALLRIFFKLLYHQFAFTYDFVASVVSLGAWQKWVASVIPYVDGPKALEIGFGPGHLQAGFNQKGIIAYGLDESRQMAGIAHQHLSRQGYPIKLVRGQAQLLPFADNCFHQVVLTFPAEYIRNPSTLIEIHRVLIDGGVAIILPLAWITGQKPWHRLAAWVNHVTGEAPKWDDRILEPLKSSGFEVSHEMLDFNTSKILLIRLRKSPSK